MSQNLSRGSDTLDRFRAPNGADEVAIAECSGNTEAVHLLLARCLVSKDGESVPADVAIPDGIIAEVDAAIEQCMPEVAPEIMAQCPQCGAGNRCGLDLEQVLKSSVGDIFAEVHKLA